MTRSTWDDAEAAHLADVSGLARRLLAAEDPYEVALEIMGTSAMVMRVDPAGSVYRIWGVLTDWIELKPDERERAEAEMARAAREWLALDLADRGAVGTYLDYWEYDVCGYERSQPDRGAVAPDF
ncbi:hypothetical protein Afil01_31930 [Actinorhabdospora filicis]|uniref:Uncharacterized protein n=1 Tax=Actinorhabdospora filicis TaxID=1785913 RepID=A0A9W6SPJ5_9ACTN|nr:hypothetical protein [Actinorhabdospora filicis]GLZ78386.1 hypothetical protein Afil01_31930 [Actinorhabdospora filicis]